MSVLHKKLIYDIITEDKYITETLGFKTFSILKQKDINERVTDDMKYIFIYEKPAQPTVNDAFLTYIYEVDILVSEKYGEQADLCYDQIHALLGERYIIRDKRGFNIRLIQPLGQLATNNTQYQKGLLFGIYNLKTREKITP